MYSYLFISLCCFVPVSHWRVQWFNENLSDFYHSSGCAGFYTAHWMLSKFSTLDLTFSEKEEFHFSLSLQSHDWVTQSTLFTLWLIRFTKVFNPWYNFATPTVDTSGAGVDNATSGFEWFNLKHCNHVETIHLAPSPQDDRRQGCTLGFSAKIFKFLMTHLNGSAFTVYWALNILRLVRIWRIRKDLVTSAW